MIEHKCIRVYIVDDHPLVNRRLRAMFEDYSRIEVAGGALGSEATLRETPELRPEVALVDWRLFVPSIEDSGASASAADPHRMQG
jgi:DNA-binding NarL/FixJ family response regulator